MRVDSGQEASARGQLFDALPVTLTVSLGRIRRPVGLLLSLGPDEILTLDTAVDDPVGLYAGDTLVAEGELHEVDTAEGKRLALRITRLAEPDDGG